MKRSNKSIPQLVQVFLMTCCSLVWLIGGLIYQIKLDIDTFLLFCDNVEKFIEEKVQLLWDICGTSRPSCLTIPCQWAPRSEVAKQGPSQGNQCWGSQGHSRGGRNKGIGILWRTCWLVCVITHLQVLFIMYSSSHVSICVHLFA